MADWHWAEHFFFFAAMQNDPSHSTLYGQVTGLACIMKCEKLIYKYRTKSLCSFTILFFMHSQMTLKSDRMGKHIDMIIAGVNLRTVQRSKKNRTDISFSVTFICMSRLFINFFINALWCYLMPRHLAAHLIVLSHSWIVIRLHTDIHSFDRSLMYVLYNVGDTSKQGTNGTTAVFQQPYRTVDTCKFVSKTGTT